MQLTIAQARALNIPEEYIRMAEEHAEPSRPTPTPSKVKAPDGMNKLERSFAATLDRAQVRSFVRAWWFESIKLRIAGRCTYCPDFFVDVDDDRLTFVETKGPFAREDSIIKLKAAASFYPCFRWLLVRRAGIHGWEVREVDRSGIGREPIAVSWIGGGS